MSLSNIVGELRGLGNARNQVGSPLSNCVGRGGVVRVADQRIVSHLARAPLEKSQLLGSAVVGNDISVSAVEVNAVILVNLGKSIAEGGCVGGVEEDSHLCVSHASAVLELFLVEVTIPGSIDPELEIREVSEVKGGTRGVSGQLIVDLADVALAGLVSLVVISSHLS